MATTDTLSTLSIFNGPHTRDLTYGDLADSLIYIPDRSPVVDAVIDEVYEFCTDEDGYYDHEDVDYHLIPAMERLARDMDIAAVMF